MEAALRATEANETVGPLMKSNELTNSSTSTAEMELSKRVPSFERDAVSAAAFAQPLGMLCSSAIARSDQMNHSHIMYHLGRVPPTAKNGQTSLRTHERRRHLAQKRLGARLLAAQHVAQHVRRRASMQRRSFSPTARLSGSRAKNACQMCAANTFARTGRLAEE